MKKLTFLLFFSTAFTAPLDANTIKQIDQFVAQEMQVGAVPGVQLVAIKDDQVVYARGYGYADLTTKRLMTPNTPMIIGSTTKAMTALAVMQLVEQGKLNLDKKVIDYLPWFKMEGQSDQITLRQLLDHTSGIAGTIDSSDYQGDDAIEHRVKQLVNVKMNRIPGNGYEYANDSYTIAGLLIEKASGMPYQTYMEQKIFKALLMKNTTFDLNIAKDLGLAQGYAPTGSTLSPKNLTIAKGVTPAGLAISNVMDISNYLKMWLDDGVFGKNKVISSESITKIWEKSSQVSEQVNYGLGWFLSESDGLKIIDHAGDANIMSSEFMLIPEKKIAVAVLVNRDNELTTNIGKGITDILLGKKPKLSQARPPRSRNGFKPDVTVWQKYVGDYETEQGIIKIFVRDGHLYATLTSILGIEVELEAMSDDKFTIISNIAQIDGQNIGFSNDSKNKTIFLFNDKPFGTKK